MDPYFMIIMKATGYFILTIAAIIVITFLVWVVKLEFSWFFGLNIFKWFNDKALKVKIWLTRSLRRTKAEIEEANEQGELDVNYPEKVKKVRKNVKLNEEI